MVSPGGDAAAGTVRRAVNLGWTDVPVAEVLSSRSGRPVAVDHDVRAAARAEAVLGAGAGEPDVLLVALGTGVAAASVGSGGLRDGATGRAGELGHMVVVPGGRACPCGQRGCLERYAAAPAVARRYRELGGTGPADAAVVVDRLDTEPAARQAWLEAIDALAAALTAATALLDPGVVVLAGGLAGAGTRLLDPLQHSLAGRATWRPAPAVRLGRLGPVAARSGAALSAWALVGATDGWRWPLADRVTDDRCPTGRPADRASDREAGSAASVPA